MKSKKLFLLITILVLAILSTLISNSIDKTNTDTRSQAASTPAKIKFPNDHIFHSTFKREWWYLSLMIRSSSDNNKTNKDTGYLISFSKIDGINGLLTSRFDRSNNKFNQKTNYPGKLSTNLNKGLFTVSFSKTNGPSMVLKELSPLKNGAKQYSLKGSSLEIGTFDLTLTEKTVNSSGSNTPLLWGCTGNISVFKENDTYYYSIPDLDITGTITDIDKSSRKVIVGKAWMDHQWFDSTPSEDWVGHYWSNLYLTERDDFSGPHLAIGAVTQIYKKKGPTYSYWVKRNIDGTNECGNNLKFSINSYSNKYPSNIDLSINDNQDKPIFSVKIAPFSSNQIFSNPDLHPSFFEPMSFLTGTSKGKNYTGLGFFETAIKK